MRRGRRHLKAARAESPHFTLIETLIAAIVRSRAMYACYQSQAAPRTPLASPCA